MKIPFFGKDKPSAESTAPQVKPQVQSVRIFNTIEQEGYYCYSAEHFLQSNEFLPLINKISSALGGRKEVFERYLLPSIKEVATFAQKIPASEVKDGKPSNIFGHHLAEGGLLLHSLETMYFALNDSRLAFFNKGINPSDRDRHLVASRVACALSGLLHDIGKLHDVEIVTYTVEEGKKIEHQWKCIESIPSWLARIHNIEVSEVYKNKENNPPTYIIKGWKKGRSSKHEVIGPFLMRAFINKSALKFLSDDNENLLNDFMTAIDWNVLAPDITKARQNIVYEIWHRADITSSERNRRNNSSKNKMPIESNTEIKKSITKAMQLLIDNAVIAVNKMDSNCFLFSHSLNSQETPFVILARFDEASLGMWLNVISKASTLYKSDVLQDHLPNLENIYTLLNKCGFLLPSKNEDGFYNLQLLISDKKLSCKAVCFADYKDVILLNGQLYHAQENDLKTLTMTFTDHILPEISVSTHNTDDLTSDLDENYERRSLSTKEVREQQDKQKKAEDLKKFIEENSSQAPEIVPVDSSQGSETNEMSEDEMALDAPDGFQTSSGFVSKLYSQNSKEQLEESPKPCLSEPDDRPLVLKEDQIRNFDKAIYDYKTNQKILVDEQKPNAIKIKELPDNTLNQKIFESIDEPYFNGLTLEVVTAIKKVADKIQDKKVARNFSIQICNRLLGKAFSYIDFVTVDNKYCYAAFQWNEEVVKDAHAISYIKGFDSAQLFPRKYDDLLENSKELYYFQHIQMIKAVTSIFKIAGIKPYKIKCLDHPYERISGATNITEHVLVEYLKHKIISLDNDETLFGYRATGYAHEAKGRRIDKAVLKECAKYYKTSINRIQSILSIKNQTTPPYMIADGTDLVVGYQKLLKQKELKPEEKNKIASESGALEMMGQPFYMSNLK